MRCWPLLLTTTYHHFMVLRIGWLNAVVHVVHYWYAWPRLFNSKVTVIYITNVIYHGCKLKPYMIFRLFSLFTGKTYRRDISPQLQIYVVVWACIQRVSATLVVILEEKMRNWRRHATKNSFSLVQPVGNFHPWMFTSYRDDLLRHLCSVNMVYKRHLLHAAWPVSILRDRPLVCFSCIFRNCLQYCINGGTNVKNCVQTVYTRAEDLCKVCTPIFTFISP